MNKREIIARAICLERCAQKGDKPCFEVAEGFAPDCECPWQADAVLAALNEHGLVIRPREPTEEMNIEGRSAASREIAIYQHLDKAVAEIYIAMVDADEV